LIRWISNSLRGNGAASGPAGPARLSFEAVSRTYGALAALDGVTFAVEPGSVFGLLGPSGCGKTTLLRIAAGIERPSAGRVLLNDSVLASERAFMPPEVRGVGLMFQDFALFPHLTIVDNVKFGLKSRAAGEAQRVALAMLDRVGLAAYADAYPHILSGGQQQRVALARAIAPRPSVLLMDEPFSGLDVQLRDSMQQETLSLLRDAQMTAMIVTHHPEEAMRLSDRIGVMRGGRLVQVGTSQDLYHRPTDLFVARLFSEINEVRGKVTGDAIDTPFGRLAANGAADGSEVVVGVRERGIALAPSANGQGLKGRILDAKFLGDATLIDIAVEGLAAPLRVRTPAGGSFQDRGEVGLSVDPAQTLVFPAPLQEAD